MNAEEFKEQVEEKTKILEKSLNSGSMLREVVESWVYNKAREIKQNTKGRKVTFNLHHLKAAFKKLYSETLSRMYVKMRLLELKESKKPKKKWKKRNIPGLNS